MLKRLALASRSCRAARFAGASPAGSPPTPAPARRAGTVDRAQGRPPLRRHLGQAGLARRGGGDRRQDRRRRQRRRGARRRPRRRPRRRHAAAGPHRRPRPPDRRGVGRTGTATSPTASCSCPAEQALLRHRPTRKRTLEAGFTTVRNVGADDYIDVGLRNAIDAGVVAGPRMLTAVHAIGSTGGHGDGAALRPQPHRASSARSRASATAPTSAAPRCATRSSTAPT